ncbi:MAG TPA: tetratricopeptide repeat protein [Burkholderiaceae bacterium]
MSARIAASILLSLAASSPGVARAAAVDLAALWDFAKPELSEQRFRAALAGASPDDALILQTQIARTHGLRGEFAKAREILRSVEPQLAAASAEVKVRYALELGRSYASPAHPAESQTPEARERARGAYQQALDQAKAAQLDGLAVDALHMFAFVDTAPADQLRWGREALAVVEASNQEAAKRWEASIRNNVGLALHQLGRYDEALAELNAALALRERGSNPQAVREARWMVAWTLRALGRTDEALAIQLRLERENDAAGMRDEYVYEELAELYKRKGDAERAAHYAALHAQARPGGAK